MGERRARHGGKRGLLIPLALAASIMPALATAQTGTRCAAERGLASQDSNTRTQLTVVNDADYPIRLYWLDYQGRRVQFARLAPGERHRRITYASHPWIITDLANNCRQVFFAESQDQTVRFDAAGYQPPPYDPGRYDPKRYDDDRRLDDRYDPRRYDDRDTVEPLTERDAYRQIDVGVGQRLVIALPSNGSTGYHWDTAFEKNVQILGDITEQRAPGAMIGAGGTSLVRLRVTQPGPAEVTLMYLPPGGGRSRRTYTFRFRGY